MSILKIKDSQGNWVGVPTVKGDTGNGISSAILNDDYTLTLTFTDGTTYKTPSIRGEKGEKGEPATDMEIHICSASEYDAETRIPTIANPNDKTFYLVPTEDGTSPDLFTEWVYVNGAWEKFGSAKIDLSGYLTDVTVDGNSIVSDGVAEIPIAGSGIKGVVSVINSYGLNVVNGNIAISRATGYDFQNANNKFRPIVTSEQHNSVFYGLAKASGDSTQSASDNAVGTYTEEAKIAIQKMLGVYQAPWELIKEDTFTNATEADYTITSGSDGQPFYLTDVLMMFETPRQDTYAEKGNYGQIWFLDSMGNIYASEGDEWTQDAQSSPHGIMTLIEQKNGIIFMSYSMQTTSINSTRIQYRYGSGFEGSSQSIFVPENDFVITQVKIPAVTGTGHYKLFGKRKW